MTGTGRPSIARLDVTRHHLQVRPHALSSAATAEGIASEGKRLGGQLAASIRNATAIGAALTYSSEGALLGYAADMVDFFILDLAKHMQAYDRRELGVRRPMLTVNGRRPAMGCMARTRLR